MKVRSTILSCYKPIAVWILSIGAVQMPAQAKAPSASDSLTLDQTTLVLGSPGAGKTVSLKVNTLTLVNGAKIITNGNTLRITAAKIVSHDGSIISFQDDKLTPSDAADGVIGTNGLSGGTVELSASELEGQLIVSIPGQNGGRGGRGGPGVPGPNGAHGSDGRDSLFVCIVGAGNGSPGGNGGAGSPGQPGGNGDNGGKLVLEGVLSKESDSITFTGNGGQPGPGGPGGLGGSGGHGGPGGSGSVHCRGGSPGLDGESGAEGPAGPKGNAGAPGSEMKSAN